LAKRQWCFAGYERPESYARRAGRGTTGSEAAGQIDPLDRFESMMI
jgi:hypothetical protein